MNMRRAFDAAISIFSSPSKRQATVPTAAPVDVSRINGVPPDWIGIKCGNRVEPSRRRFPCIGTACAARGIFHEQGSEAQGFRDYSDFGKDTEWQHMCAACAIASTPRSRHPPSSYANFPSALATPRRVSITWTGGGDPGLLDLVGPRCLNALSSTVTIRLSRPRDPAGSRPTPY